MHGGKRAACRRKSVEQKIGELEAGAGNEVITEEEINRLFQ